MKSSILLRADLNDEARYDGLVRNVHDLLLNDSLVIHEELFRVEGPFTDPKVSSYILAYYGTHGSIVDYSSHQRTDERFERGDIWIRVIGNKPEPTANCIYQHLGHYFEREKRNWLETAINYARMKDKLKVIYIPEEMEEILDEVESGEVRVEDISPPRGIDINGPIFQSVIAFTKQELIQNLRDLLLEDLIKHLSEE